MAHKKSQACVGPGFPTESADGRDYCWVTIAVLLLPVWLTLA